MLKNKNKKEIEKVAIIHLERLKEIDPDLAILVQDTVRSNYALRAKIDELLKENVRLNEEKVALEIRLRSLETSLEAWRGEYEKLSNAYERLEKEYINLKAQYNKVIMLKGVTELTYEGMLKALEDLINRLDEFYSKPSFKLGEEHVKTTIREIREEILSIIKGLKEKKEQIATTEEQT